MSEEEEVKKEEEEWNGRVRRGEAGSGTSERVSE